MNDVMAIGLQALQADASRLERVSANLANALTPGYRREIGIQRADTRAGRPEATFTRLLESHAGHARQETPNAGSARDEVMRDMRVGTLKSSGQPLDFALTGPGFFEVATPTGPAYTRQGQFRLDAGGRLVTQQGHPVMGTGGDIVLTSMPSVDAGGALSENGRTVGKLRIVDFGAAERMERLAGGLFAGAGQPLAVDERDSQVRQGFVENANVDTGREMVELIRTMRHFESMQRVVQGYDEMLGSAIRKLGDL